MKTLREQIAGRCKHYAAPATHDTCAVGVSFNAMQTEAKNLGVRWFEAIPCFKGEGRKLTCSRCAFPTPEEVEAEVAECDASFGRIKRARAAIVASKKTHGEIDCPNCKGGKLRFSVAKLNGHIHAACSTKGCAAWME